MGNGVSRAYVDNADNAEKKFLDYVSGLDSSTINDTNDQYLTALAFAAHKGYMSAVTKLLASKADVNKSEEFTPLMAASNKGRSNVASALIAAKADVNMVSETKGCTALMFAAGSKDESMAKKVTGLLLQAKADVNIVRPDKNVTALSYAQGRGHVDLIEMLKTAGDKSCGGGKGCSK